MSHFAPESLERATGGRWIGRPAAAAITGFSADSRQLRAGEMFVALKTERRDGHAFLAAAASAGAAAALVAVPDASVSLPQLAVADPLAGLQAIAREHRRAFRGPVIGITGSAGKTSTKNLLALLLDESRILATEGNLNNHLGVPLTLTRLDSAIHRAAVVEAGIAAPGEMAPLAAMIEPEIAIVTLVAPAHLAQLGSVEGVAREKAMLVAAVRPGGRAIFPHSCLQFAPFRSPRANTTVVQRAGENPFAAVTTVIFALEHRGDMTVLTLKDGPTTGETFILRRITDGMAQNAALAICAARHLGVESGAIRERLARWEPARLRGEIRREGGRLLYLDCYNANPVAMADALAAFVAVAPPGLPRLFVLGGMEDLGPDSARFHRELGRGIALGPDDFLCVIGDEADQVRAGARERGTSERQIAVARSLQAVAARVAGFDGAVFIKGSRRWQLEKVVAEMAGTAH